MAGIDLETELVSLTRGFFQTSQLSLKPGGIGVGEAASMELNDRGADGRGGRNLRGIGIDEEADENAGLAKFLDDGAEGFFLPGRIQSALGGDLGTVFRNQTDLGGLQAERKLNHGGRGRHFQVESVAKLTADPQDVIVLDVPAVLPEVDSERVGPRGKAQAGRPKGIRFRSRGGGVVPVAGLPQRGDMVNIHAQANHRARIPPYRG